MLQKNSPSSGKIDKMQMNQLKMRWPFSFFVGKKACCLIPLCAVWNVSCGQQNSLDAVPSAAKSETLQPLRAPSQPYANLWLSEQYETVGEQPVRCTESGPDVAQAILDSARLLGQLCEEQNVQMAKDGYERCPTQMCFAESTTTDPDNPVLKVDVTYSTDLGSGGGGSGGGGFPGFPGGGSSSPQRLTIAVSLTVPLGGPRHITKCVSPLTSSLFTDLRNKIISATAGESGKPCRS